ncbi:PEP-CTERM sorting domain-containing protein [Oxalobacteraceae bacterium OTU3CINTB1]|nr:PEP-CTERM sorting domain-containing protein [Oxalobacteraceae bacterium OTU3CINTB1]
MVSVQGTRPQPQPQPRSHFRSRSSRLRTALRLIPLLCAAWAGNAAAIDVIYQGPPGGSGLTGAAPGAAGGNGMTAPSAVRAEFSLDLANTMAVTGGKGGDGGNGATGNASVLGGNAGTGGDGAFTIGSLTATLITGPASVAVSSTGGLGGNAGQPGARNGGPGPGQGAIGGKGGNANASAALITSANTPGQVAASATGGQGGVGSAGFASGNGGAATSNARAISIGSAPLQLTSSATGGVGGAALFESAQAGAGGAASATNGLGLPGSGVLDLTMLTTATGGRGGEANFDFELAPHANGGNGGTATVSNTAAYAGNTLTLAQTATGGAGGAALFGQAGHGGNATSTIALSSGAASTVNVAGTAVGGQGGAAVGGPFGPGPDYGAPGGGGSANSQLSLTSSATGWNAQITGTSTAIAGLKGEGSFLARDGGAADAVSVVNGGGRVTSLADATGEYGSGAGGQGNAQATANANYIAIARANATGGGAYFNGGAGAYATATARAGYFASAEATANPGSGHFGWTDGGSASAQAVVTRAAGDTAPVSPTQPSEARARAVATRMGSIVEARSTYNDLGRGAAVTTRAVGDQPALYTPEAASAANVGGAAYGPWTPEQGPGPTIASYASALPTAASVAPMIASSAEVATAFADATTLAAGTMAGVFAPRPITASAQLNLPFGAGNHLLLALVQPFLSPFTDSSFSFSVANGGVSLYSGSFTTLAQADAVFNGHVLDLGAVNANSLDLLITFTLESGLYGFSYLVGQGPALAPVPEPGTWLLLMLGLALLAWRAGAFKTARTSPMSRTA